MFFCPGPHLICSSVLIPGGFERTEGREGGGGKVWFGAERGGGGGGGGRRERVDDL